MSDMRLVLSLPQDPRVISYFDPMRMGSLQPMVFTNWRDECRSWKETAYLSTNISTDAAMLYLEGPDAARLLDENCVNKISAMPVGSARHAIMCAETGNIVCDGMVLRFAEDVFGCYALQPLIVFLSMCGKYDVKPIEYKVYDYLFQVAGPKSLEILEQACQEDLHDIKFLRFRHAQIAGHEVRVLRIGMAGTLGYEVHGLLEDSHEVYEKIWEAGAPLGLRKLGYTAYTFDHAENGFPQGGIHFMPAWAEHDGLWAMMSSIESGGDFDVTNLPLNGSLVSPDRDNLRDCYRNPIELGWENHINWDHDFSGKEALRRIAEGRHREVATLTWNVEDILDIQASYFRTDDEPYKDLVYPVAFPLDGLLGTQQNKVMDEDGTIVGVACIPEYSISYRKLFCLASIDQEFNEYGRELRLVWGEPGGRQKVVRVNVDRYPLLDECRNQHFDVETVPHFGA